MNKIIQGDCLEKLKELEDNSVDSIVTDPPAGISFMGKSWDSDKGGRDNWIAWMCEVATECNRVLKPGGHAFVWAIPRTSHWTATAWENAGFEIRDVVAHVFGSGFPKSLNIGKAVDKLQGNEREVVGKEKGAGTTGDNQVGNQTFVAKNQYEDGTHDITKGTSKWEGWGTALKPAREDWILMRKPIECKTVAENVLKYGTGGINIDESRVETTDDMKETKYPAGRAMCPGGGDRNTPEVKIIPNSLGRFPANLLHDNSEEVRECFPNQSERFFKSIIYQAKASKSERNKGCEEMEEKNIDYAGRTGQNNSSHRPDGSERKENISKNNHPTVKPIALMEYLIKMVTPKGGVVLDPFAGSGSTLIAARQNGFQYIGIELTEEYIPIIEARLKAVQERLL